MFIDVDKSIKDKLKEKDRDYPGSKPNPEDWTDLTEFDYDFNEEFNRIFNDPHIKEADDYTTEVLDDTYPTMELAMPRNSEGPEFTKVTKRIRDTVGISIGTTHDNPILDPRVYEIEYPDRYRASLPANVIAPNIFAQVHAEGNRHVLFDEIVNHRTDGTEIKLVE